MCSEQGNMLKCKESVEVSPDTIRAVLSLHVEREGKQLRRDKKDEEWKVTTKRWL